MPILFRKYKFVLIPLLMVLVFDLSLLVINFSLSAQLEISANNINIAGRQRMLSQMIVKTVALINIHSLNDARVQKEQAELQDALNLFNQTFSAFLEGGFATSASGDVITVKKLDDPKAIAILQQAKTIWTPLQRDLDNLFISNTYSGDDLTRLINALTDKNTELLGLMNDLTNYLEKDARQKTYFLRGLQILIICLVFLSFIVASFRLYRRENYYDNLMEKTTDVVISIDLKTAQLTFVSSSVADLLGHDANYYLGKPASLFFSGEAHYVLSQILKHIEVAGTLEHSRCEIQLQKQDGSIIVADMVMQLLTSADGRSQELAADIRDISERKQAEVALAELAHKDVLTGLATRSLFYELVEHALRLAKRDQEYLALLFVDLDDFKAVNDNFGHDVGDIVLKTAANRIVSCLRESDSACRLGGDEFVVLIEHVDKPEEMKNLATKIVEAISEDIPVDDMQCRVGASVGIALYPQNGSDIDALIKSADKAMYKVKNTGKCTVLFA